MWKQQQQFRRYNLRRHSKFEIPKKQNIKYNRNFPREIEPTQNKDVLKSGQSRLLSSAHTNPGEIRSMIIHKLEKADLLNNKFFKSDCSQLKSNFLEMLLEEQNLLWLVFFTAKLTDGSLLQYFYNQKKEMKSIWHFLLVICIIEVGKTQNLVVSLNDSLLLNQQSSGIKTIGKDLQGNFFVSFDNGEARKYLPDFSSFISIAVPEPVDQFNTRLTSFSIILSNGSSLNLTDHKIIMRSQNFTMVRDYNYYSYLLQESYSVNQTILCEMGYPIMVSNISHIFHVLICNSSIQVAYKGVVTYLLNYSTLFGSNSTCIAAAVNNGNRVSTSHNSFSFNLLFYVSFSGGSVYEFNVTLVFQFNSTVNHFDLSSQSQAHVLITTSPTPITSLFLTTGLLMMQSNSSGLTTIYNINSSSMGTTSGIPLNRTFNFIYANGALYVLQSTGLQQLAFNSTANTLSARTYAITLPYNNYRISLGSIIDAFYIPGRPYLYKGSTCSGQTQLQGSTCVAYNCSIGNCSSCPISALLCSVCKTGFFLEQNYTCTLRIPISTTNSTTNSTIISSTNSTNTNTANFSNINSTSNSSNTENSTSSINEFTGEPSSSFSLKSLIQYLLGIIQTLISIPAARRVLSPVFYYFCIFDDIYLFQFHDRLYGAAMNNLFANINDIQSKKWSLLDYQTVLALLQVDPTAFQNATDYQNTYNDYPFTDANHTDVGSEGLWANCQNFFVVALPLTLVAFLTFRLLFRLSFHHAVSLWVRKFDLWPFLLLLLFDGNIQEFAFYQATDWKHMFSTSALQKVIKVQIICFGFLLLVVSTALYFLARSFYARLSRHVMDNNRSGIAGMAALTLQTGVKNYCLGVLHSVLREAGYERMLWSLLGCEAVFLLCFMVMLMAGVYRRALKMWVYVLLNLVKMLLMTTLLVDYQFLNIPTIESTQLALIVAELVLFAFGVSLETYCTFKQLFLITKRMFQTNPQPTSQKSTSNEAPTQFTLKLGTHKKTIANKNIFKIQRSELLKGTFSERQKLNSSIKQKRVRTYFASKLTLKVTYQDREAFSPSNSYYF